MKTADLQAFCVDSVDAESWYNKARSSSRSAPRGMSHMIVIWCDELIPFVRSREHFTALAVTGCSFGGYHSVNFALRHPDLVAACVSMGGAFDIHQFLDGYYDDNCYYNCPPDFLPNLNDPWFLDRYRRMKIVLATGETDICLEENLRLSRIMSAKGIPHLAGCVGRWHRARLAVVGADGAEVFLTVRVCLKSGVERTCSPP